MSYILDALNKAEQERRIGEVPNLDTQHKHEITPNKNIWPVVAVIALVVNAGLIGFAVHVFYPGKTTENTPAINEVKAVDPVTNQQTLNASPQGLPHIDVSAATQQKINPQTNLPVPTPTIKKKPKETADKRIVQPLALQAKSISNRPDASEQKTVNKENRNLESAQSASQTNSEPDNTPVPLLLEKSSEFQQSMPKLNIDVHVYAKKRAKRFVLVNLRKYHEHDKIMEGLYLEEITSDGIILRYHNERVKILKP